MESTPVKEEQKQPPAPAASADQTAALVASEKSAVTRVPVRMGMAPQTLEEGWRLAQYIANSEMVPKQYQGKPGDVLIAIQYGMELGFPPMQALQSIAVINGRPAVWGDGFLALIMGSRCYRDHDEYFLVKGERQDILRGDDLKDDNTTAVCVFWRTDKETPITGYFSVGQAKKASLFGKQGPWQTFPDRMLKMRARGFAGRDGFADVLRAVRTAEELIDLPDGELPELPARPEPIAPRRASEARTSSTPAPSSPAAAQPPEPAAESSSAPAPAAAPPAAPASARETRGLRITGTAFVRPKDTNIEPYYEVRGKTASGPELVFVTRDEGTYKEAASFEGTDHLVVVGWRTAKLAEKTAIVNVIDRLGIDDSGNDGLFR